MKKMPFERDFPRTLDRTVYVPMHIVGLANKLSRGSSKIYLRLFGVGIIEWRIVSILSVNSDISANAICVRLDLDKAAASRSVKVLEDKELINVRADPHDSRRRLLSLSPKGQKMHNKILRIALKRQEHLLSGFSPGETALLLEMLKRLAENTEIVDDFDYDVLIETTDGCQSTD